MAKRNQRRGARRMPNALRQGVPGEVRAPLPGTDLSDLLRGPRDDSFDALCDWTAGLVERAGLTDEDLARIHRRVRERLEGGH